MPYDPMTGQFIQPTAPGTATPGLASVYQGGIQDIGRQSEEAKGFQAQMDALNAKVINEQGGVWTDDQKKEFSNLKSSQLDNYGAIPISAKNFDYRGTNEGAFGQMAATAQDPTLGALALQRQAALGQAPSVAQLQMQQGANNAIAAQMAMAASARGGAQNLAAAQQGAQFNAANINSQSNAQAAMLRAQEMEQARNAYMQGQAAQQQYALGLYGMGQKASLARQMGGTQFEQANIAAEEARRQHILNERGLEEQGNQFNAQMKWDKTKAAVGQINKTESTLGSMFGMGAMGGGGGG